MQFGTWNLKHPDAEQARERIAFLNRYAGPYRHGRQAKGHTNVAVLRFDALGVSARGIAWVMDSDLILAPDAVQLLVLHRHLLRVP